LRIIKWLGGGRIGSAVTLSSPPFSALTVNRVEVKIPMEPHGRVSYSASLILSG
jgi:hypothetical protein